MSRVGQAGILKAARSFGPVLILLLAIAGVGQIRLRLLSMPLERDEGEYAYAGQRILEGDPPYKHLYNMKWPGTYYSYALIEAVFGQTIEGIRRGILLVNAAAIVAVFFIARRLLDGVAAAAAAVSYAILSLGPASLGFDGHATHFVVLCALAAILLLQESLKRQWLSLYFATGVFAGLAPIMKQPGIVFTAFVFAYWGWDEFRSRKANIRRQTIRRGAALSAGSVLPFVVLFCSLLANHTLGTFWLWTVSYARYYSVPLPTSLVPAHFLNGVYKATGEAFLFWITAGVAIGLLRLTPQTRKAAPLVLGLFGFSFLGILPGFFFRAHYFILMLPAVAILVGCAAYVVRIRMLEGSPQIATICAAVVVLLPLSAALWLERGFYFYMTPDVARQYTQPGNPFVECVAIAKVLQEHTKPGEPIAVLGSEPQVYFYAHRPAATGFMYTYALMEEQPFAHQFQEQMIHEIESAKPKYLVYFGGISSWAPKEHSDPTILDWFHKESKTWKLMGVVQVDQQRLLEVYECRWKS